MMASGFPGAIDNFTDPLANSLLTSPSHATLHSDVNDAIEKIETYMGLVYIAGTTFSATTTPFINGCFSSLYENYKVLISCGGSNIADVHFRFRSGTSTPETGAVYDRYGFSSSATLATANATALTSGIIGGVFSSTTAQMVTTMEIFNPNSATKHKNAMIQGWDVNSGSSYFFTHRVATTTQYTGIQIQADTGTLTGTIRVYGYRN